MPADLSLTARGPALDLSRFAPVDLCEVVDHAAMLTRVDRKYLVDAATAAAFLARLPDAYRLLHVDGRPATTYSSVYFDTAAMDACRDHVQRRRRRWKVRTRLYVEDRLCRVEVKTRDGRGVTVKTVADSTPLRHGRLDGPEGDFVATTLDAAGLPLDARALRQTMEVDYRRSTLADTGRGSRVTLDRGVECRHGGGRVRLDDGYVLIETKGAARPSDADRVLGTLGARPRSFSKYASAASLLRADIADNDVRRLCGRELHAVRAESLGTSA